MPLLNPFRRSAHRPSLRERAAELRERLVQPAGPTTGATNAEAEPLADIPDPTFAAVVEYRTAWDVAGEAALVDGNVPDEEAEAMVQAYDRLRAVRPTTAAGYRALAATWAWRIEQDGEPGDGLGDHIAQSLIAGAGVCVPDSPIPATDSEILSLGRQLDAAHAAWREAERTNRDPQKRLKEALEEAKARGGPIYDDLSRAWKLPGVEEAHDAESKAFDDLNPICDAIWRAPAHSPAGLAVKARAALIHIWPRGNYEADAALGEDEGLTEESARRLVEACCALAGVNWKGEPVAAPAPPSAAPSNLDALALVSAIEAEWGDMARSGVLEHNGPENDEALDMACDRRNALLDAADALPADTREARHAKALALAWIEWVELISSASASRRSTTEERLVFDIHAGMRDAPESAMATSTRPRDLDLVGLIDLAAANMFELRMIREAAGAIDDVVSAMTWQGCHRLADGPYGDARHTASGEWLVKLADAFCRVISATEKEARRRTPTSARDQEHRLALLAVSTIENGDPTETAAFARELLATVEP